MSSSSTAESKPLILSIKIHDLIDPNTKTFSKQKEQITQNKTYDVVQIEDLEESLTPEVLHSLKDSLNDNGHLILVFSEAFKNEDNSMFKSVSSLKFAGYIETKIETLGNVYKLSGKKRKKGKTAEKKAENPWKNINLDVQSDLVLEEELVDPFDTYQKFAKKSDCVTKPKPCKNCNCGRADNQAGNSQNTTGNTGNSAVASVDASSCGRCYLGDAFRCAGCPYKGKPAFEPGDKIDFSDQNGNGFVSTEVQAPIEAEEVNVKYDKTNKIIIDI